MNIEILAIISGFIGAVLFACKSAPQVLECWKKKSTEGLSFKMLLMDFGGNIFSALYVLFVSISTGHWLISNLCNYFIASIFLIILFVLIKKFKKH